LTEACVVSSSLKLGPPSSCLLISATQLMNSLKLDGSDVTVTERTLQTSFSFTSLILVEKEHR
jgi:hypothetical protein